MISASLAPIQTMLVDGSHAIEWRIGHVEAWVSDQLMALPQENWAAYFQI
jgi:hypothetical protein